MTPLTETTAEVTPRLRMIAALCVTQGYLDTMHRERDALLSLAKTQRRLSWMYRRWATEDRASGKRHVSEHYADEADRLWRDAKSHLQAAKARNF